MKKSYNILLAAFAAVCLLVSCTVDNGKIYPKTYLANKVLIKVESATLSSVLNDLETAHYVNEWRLATGENKEMVSWYYFSNIYEDAGVVYVNRNEVWEPGDKPLNEVGSIWLCVTEDSRVEITCVGEGLWEVNKYYDVNGVRYAVEMIVTMTMDEGYSYQKLRSIEFLSGILSYEEIPNSGESVTVTAEVIEPVFYGSILEWPFDGKMEFLYSDRDEEEISFQVAFEFNKYWIYWSGQEESYSSYGWNHTAL